MTRLLGFLSGLLLVVALAFVVLRYPPTDQPVEEPGLGPAPQPAQEPIQEPIQASIQGSTAETDQESARPAATVETLPRVDDPPPAPVTAAAAAVAEDADDDDTATPADDADQPDRQWHAFWQPFHSEVSAEGFRRRLEGVTGLDYRVVSPRPGEYQVTFAYRDEAERQENLAAIEAATGLVLRSRML